jgi:hypothetical protein
VPSLDPSCKLDQKFSAENFSAEDVFLGKGKVIIDSKKV